MADESKDDTSYASGGSASPLKRGRRPPKPTKDKGRPKPAKREKPKFNPKGGRKKPPAKPMPPVPESKAAPPIPPNMTEQLNMNLTIHRWRLRRLGTMRMWIWTPRLRPSRTPIWVCCSKSKT